MGVAALGPPCGPSISTNASFLPDTCPQAQAYCLVTQGDFLRGQIDEDRSRRDTHVGDGGSQVGLIAFVLFWFRTEPPFALELHR